MISTNRANLLRRYFRGIEALWNPALPFFGANSCFSRLFMHTIGASDDADFI